jgi:Secretion system C-terminal sorting domain
MKSKIDKTKLSAYLQQAGALSKNIKPSKAAAYGAMGVGMLTLPVVPTLGQCGTASYTSPNLDMNGGGTDFHFDFNYPQAIYMTRIGGWQVLVNGQDNGGYPFAKNVNGLNLTTATPWSSGGGSGDDFLLCVTFGTESDFNLGTSGFVGVRTNPGLIYGFFQVTITGTAPDPSFTSNNSQGGMDDNPATNAIGGNCSSLPVELIGFFAKLGHDHIQLSWTTASEENNAGFEIQRSLDGKDFSNIGWLDGRGTSSIQQQYSFLDENIEPVTEYFYRLKQIDIDGQSAFSPVLVITSLGKGTIISDAYPNPSKDGQIRFPFVSATDAEWTATVFNAQGIQLLQQKQLVVKGESDMPLSLGDLPKGNYFIKLENGMEQVYKKVSLL